MSIWSLILQSWIALIPLGFCSVLVVAISLDRLWAFARLGRVPGALLRRVEGFLASGNWHDAVRLLDDSGSPFARIAKASLMRRDPTEQEVADLLTVASETELADAARSVPVLGTIGNIAPFIGLFGTVIGIMEAFYEVASQGAAGAAVVSEGLSQALIATAAGLAVGIVAVIANNWCNAWLERYRVDLERFATEWAYLLRDAQQPVQSEQLEEGVV